MCALAWHFASNSADASCGDWLADPSMASHQATEHGEAPKDCPCHGPSCRSVPDMPLPTAPERTFSNDQERICRILEQLTVPPLMQSSLPMERSLFRPEGFLARVDRPPRA